MRQRLLSIFCLVSTLALLLGGCATEPNLYTGQTGYYAYTWEQELQLGRQSDAQIVQQMGLYQDDELAAYIRDLGNELLQHSAIKRSDAPEIYQDTEFTFRLLDSDVVNAFALPGGFVYVTRGLLSHLQNEAQLAVVLGHEIVHVEARHASKQALKQQLGQIGLVAGAVIGEQIAENKDFAREMVNLGGELFQLATLKYGRDAERESDLHGVEYAAKAGYAAGEGSAFFRSLDRISDKSGQSIPSWMSSHPDPGEREKTIQELASQWNAKTGQTPIVGEERFLAKIDGLVVGQNPRNGYSDGQRFYHPDLRFQFDKPAGWSLQNESGAVYLSDANRSVMLAFTIAPEKTPLAAAQALASKLSFEPTYAQDTHVNSMPAYALEGSVTTQSGVIMLHATFVQKGENVFTFLGYGTSASFPAQAGTIRSIAGSFEELTNPDILNIQPYRIAVTRADRNAAFQDLLPDRLPPGTDAHDWAIMNQVELDQQIERGQLLKLPASTR
ncbi:M48 family metalloprotease [Pelagicoccus sp. SDUM812005]|uniref:M48 family metalloprotease n=1 Tax=Pelagicoccus sp. SDUM812005 TaxID=3041257 RepID=UPI00280F9F96|nr:M48 family metalloprotease [Pelagicoccus sp. SDUM812005]MDQ8179850.1 M48 family metalloprotease [Pelagicoccus sp. SDUM812005]